MIYGYARVSTNGQSHDGNSLEYQEAQLKLHGAEKIYREIYTGSTTNRPEFEKLLSNLQAGDTLIVTKLDRIARSLSQGNELITSLIDRGIIIHILNIGILDNSPTSKLIRNIFLAFAEFERDMIMERTQEGRRISGNLGGRPPKFNKAQRDHAVELLRDHSYNQVAEMTGISKSTLLREAKKRDFKKS